jgi:mycofactocin precursor
MTVTTSDPIRVSEEHTAAPSVASAAPDAGSEDLVEEDLLVEDVSIDGMCGVY